MIPNKEKGRNSGYIPPQYKRIIPNDFLSKDYNINDLGKKFVEHCFKANEERKPDVTVSQLRKLLSAVNSIQNRLTANPGNYNNNEIQYLRIKLAYQAGREDKNKTSLKDMQKDLDPLIKEIRNETDFGKFAMLIEAIVAYHKFYGGN